MNLERLRWGEWIAAFAALDLLVVTFRAWYKVSGGGAHVTAWDALEQGRYLLIATAVVGIFLWLLKASDDPPSLSIPLGWIAAAVGFACTVYIAYRLAKPPSDNLDPDVGLYLGLASALGVTIGGLLSARDEAAEPAVALPTDDTDSEGLGTAAAAADRDALIPDSGNTWSPANPTPASSGWSPAAPAAALPPAATAAAVDAGRPLQSGDSVVLTAGGARFPAGTVAQIVEVFGGGALVEVKAADGMAERFEVPESAYERAPAGGAGVGADEWSPAMPAPAGEDWGFDEPSAGSMDTPETGAADAAAPNGEAGAVAEKVPWWKREIGGGKKKKDEAIEAGAAGAAAAGAVAIAAESNGSGEEKPGFFKRLFGGGGAKADGQTETLEGEPTPATDVAGLGQAAESDTAVDEPLGDSAVDEPPADIAVDEPTADTAVNEPAGDPDIGSAAAASSAPSAAPAPASEPEVAEPAASEPGPEPAAEPEPPAAPEPEPVASEADSAPVEPTPEPSASEPEPASVEPTPEPVTSEPEPAAVEPAPEPAASEPEFAAAGAEPEPAPSEPDPAAPEPVAAAEPDRVPDPEPPSADASEAGPEAPPVEAAGAGAAAAAAASADGAADDEPKAKRRRSSGSRKVPKEALAAAAGEEAQPKVGDEVQLKVGGGRYDAGTTGTVVDVFSAGVIVELSDDAGRTERLDLPFEAVAPADA